MGQRKSKVYSIPDNEFLELIKNSNSYREALLVLGYCGSGRGYDIIKRRCQELNLSVSHFQLFGKNTNNKIKYKLQDILVKNSSYTNMTKLKERVLREGLITYQCEQCGNTGEWNDKKLVLQLDHINGNHFDNRLENLRMLCPNCHSQTDTFTSRQRRAKITDENQ